MERSPFVCTLVSRAAKPTVCFALLCILLAASATGRNLYSDAQKPVQNMMVNVISYFQGGHTEQGFGLIIGIDNNNTRQVSVVTPNHVTCNLNEFDECTLDSVKLQFYGDKSDLVKAQVVGNRDTQLDIMFLKATAPYALDPKLRDLVAHSRMYSSGFAVQYPGMRGDDFDPKWEFIPPPPGVLTKVGVHTKRDLFAGGLRVLPGASGAPLCTDSGVVGIITDSQGNEAFLGQSMNRIKRLADGHSLVLYNLDDYEWFSYAPQWYIGLGGGVGSINIGFKELVVDSTLWYDPIMGEYWWEVGDPYIPDDVEESGNAFNLRVARGLKHNFLIGLDFDIISFAYENGVTTEFNFRNISASMTYYLSNAIYVRGGPAWSYAWYTEDDEDGPAESGFGYSFGAGAQIKIGKKWRLVPSIAYGQQDLETIKTTFINYMAGLIYVW